MMKKCIFIFILISFQLNSWASYLIINMDNAQTNHLKAYGIAFWVLENQQDVDWLLNYKGGSFMMKYKSSIERECKIRGVSYKIIADVQSSQILREITAPEINQDVVKLEKAPKIAVYSPKSKLPWDDAVTLALTYAEIPYDIVYDQEVLNGSLPLYDWLHLHHEDFTGQYGKFYSSYKNSEWYRNQKKEFEKSANTMGFQKVSKAKLEVVLKIREFTAGGGFLFAMCSATDTYDIALAAKDIDICEYMFDGDGIDPLAQEKLNFDNTFAFKNFTIEKNPNIYEFSSIDATRTRKLSQSLDFFTLFEFSAKWDPIPTMLCQNHEQVIKGFMGQTTAFKKKYLKSDVLILGETSSVNEARYIHGNFGNGTWTFYGGHDPEDYQHKVGDPKTELELHPNSPGYRLILNNVLFPAAKKKKQKT